MQNKTLLFKKKNSGYFCISTDCNDNINQMEYFGLNNEINVPSFEEIDITIGDPISNLLENNSMYLLGLFSFEDFDSAFRENSNKKIFLNTLSIAGFWLFRVLDSISDGVILVDNNEIIRFINSAYAEIKGVSPKMVIGKKVSDVLEPGKYLPEVLNTGKAILNIPMTAGKVEYIVNVYPVKYFDKIIGGVSILKDVTLAKALAEKVAFLEKAVKQSYNSVYTFNDFLGESMQIQKLISRAKKAAISQSNILITGESGTGKEILAHAIHAYSNRKDGPFVIINCSAIPNDLLESELFGYEKGAFTGAQTSKIGLFEIANHGTLFLDEIGDMNISLQAKLLRILQDRKIRRLGSTKEKYIDVRIIAATNRNLEKMIEKKEFREDLYYRLNVFPLHIPPLRERGNDIKLLAKYFLEKKTFFPKTIEFSNDTLDILQQYDWPGNVRQLENAIEFAVNMAEGNKILPINLPPMILSKINNNNYKSHYLNHVIYKTEKELIIKLLEEYGSSTAAKKNIAKNLGISLATLYNKIKKYNISS